MVQLDGYDVVDEGQVLAGGDTCLFGDDWMGYLISLKNT
jgi:hypothetical protein